MNVQASVASYAGPGGWNDPDLLIGTYDCLCLCHMLDFSILPSFAVVQKGKVFR